jgi:UDP-2,3-diacylglucosamine hydrolase
VSTLFISDLHLDDQRPLATGAFMEFLQSDASGADALYILGDLFEYWLGDDAPTPVGQAVAGALAQLVKSGVPVYFTHGNRDFLLGEAYAAAAGMTLLAEETVIDLYGAPTLLLHGDSLCTDDVVYQQIRTMLRDPAWQQDFLAKSPEERVAWALKAREMSADHKDGVAMDIMDVNAGAVAQALQRHDVKHMIHGHTHRPAVHEFNDTQRVVLGDWYEQGSVLTVSPEGLSLDALPYAMT